MNNDEHNADPQATDNATPAPSATPEPPSAESASAESASAESGNATPTPSSTVNETNATAADTTTAAATENVQETPSAEAPAPMSKIAIGSQRDAADKTLAPAQPRAVEAAVANPIDLRKSEPAEEIPLADIKSTEGLSDDIDAEIAAALGDLSMDDVVSASETSDNEIAPGTRCKAPVTNIHGDDVFLKLEGHSEGIAALHHFKEAPGVGDLVEVIVRGLNKEDGLYELAVPGAAIGASDWEDLNEGDVVEARVTGSNTGGLEAAVGAIKGFIPASQIDRFRVEDFSTYVNEKLACVVVEVNPDKRRLVLSHRAVLERENEEKRKELLAELEAGQVREGLVTKLMDFGAFVDLGGVEGLIHISKLSWSRIKHPSEIVQVGDKVKVKVESIDTESNRISLSHRDTVEHPWENINDEFQPDQIVKGTVTRIADFGAFVKIAPGVEGLVHISEIDHKRVVKVSNYLKQGDEVDVKILSLDKDAQKISLSRKAVIQPPAPKNAGKQDEEPEDQPARDLAVPQRQQPLKGGTDRKSGGESIGLKW